MIHTPYPSSVLRVPWIQVFIASTMLGKRVAVIHKRTYIGTGRCSGLAMSPVFVRWSSSCKAQQLRFPTELLGLGYTVQETAISMTDPSTIYWPWVHGNPFQRQCFAVHA